MRRNLLVVVLAMAACQPAAAQEVPPSSTSFRWLYAAKDAVLYERIKAAFADELKPDDPEKVKPVVAELYKKISRIGVFETSALVLIAERETATFAYGDYFQVFSYDLKSGKKTPSEKGFMKWRFKKLVRFDSSTIPDIVFTYLSCTECEADFLLGSFRFDSTDATWKIRSWGEKDDAILIGSDYSVGTEEDSKDDCLFKFADFNGDGFDDLAVRCLVITEQGKILEDTTTIYTIQHGQPQVLTVTDRQQLTTVRDKLCTDVKKSRLCAPKQGDPRPL
jgi:hypothetical protein